MKLFTKLFILSAAVTALSGKINKEPAKNQQISTTFLK